MTIARSHCSPIVARLAISRPLSGNQPGRAFIEQDPHLTLAQVQGNLIERVRDVGIAEFADQADGVKNREWTSLATALDGKGNLSF
jgi:hypothetical protein